jgi:C-terminal processing protease CtpA/Prc
MRAALVFVLVLLIQGCDRTAAQDDHGGVFSFESPTLDGWSGGPPETQFADSVAVHGGRYAGRIERDSESDGQFSTFTMSLPVTFSGRTLELRGWLRTEGVTGFAGLWLREDDRNGSVQFDNMQSRNLSGSTEWTEYRITLPLDEASEAPPFVHVPTAVELDTEFNDGSRIEARDLTPMQVENLALLGRVWGFAKYHHPRITSGTVNWDYELFRVLPSLLEAPDRSVANATMSEWLEGLGDPDECEPCAELPAELHLSPELGWVHDRGLLGDALSGRLQLIYDRRPAEVEHYYVTHAPHIGNPVFSNEASYADRPLPDAGFRLLALFRFWNIIEYWFPYRDVIGEEWEGVLAEFAPRVMAESTVDEYRLIMIELSARINDTHANIWAHSDLRPPRGSSELPVVLRFIEGKAVVTGFSHEVLGSATGLQIGDVVETIAGSPVDSLVAVWRPYYSASNQPKRLRDIALNLTRGDPGSVRITGTRSTGAFAVTAERVPIDDLDRDAARTDDLPGETFQLLSDEVAYLKLSSVVAADVGEYIASAEGAEVLVIDIRNYPSEFVVFALGGHLVTEPTEFARLTVGDAANPGAFFWRPGAALEPLEPHFSGSVVILVDEVSMSQAEYTAMALRAAPNSIVVGSTTAGADGNVSSIPLPGGFNSMISGIGIFYPDGTPTQRVGIVPDLAVRPTIAGVRAGRDEVLEAGVSFALGREFRLP